MGGGVGLTRPGPVFILTFRAGLYRCPSSELKGRYGLGGLSQRCQASPSSSAACDISTPTEYTQPIPSAWSRHTPSPVFPSPRGALRQDEQDVLWRRCRRRTPAMSRDLAEVLPPDLFHWQQRRNQATI